MPEESRVNSSPVGGWTVHTELLAQLVEEVSLLASDHRREEPRSVNRPYSRSDATAAGSEGQEAQQPKNPMSGHQKMLAAAARRGMVRSG